MQLGWRPVAVVQYNTVRYGIRTRELPACSLNQPRVPTITGGTAGQMK
jgi:hypothetical protein